MKPILKAAAVATVAVGLATASMSANAWERHHGGPGPWAVGAAVGAIVGLAVGAAVTQPEYVAPAPVYYAPPPPPVYYAQPAYAQPGYYYSAPVVVRPRVVYAPY
ncbi:mechanosensitive ion channel protein MscS [Bordetella sp.]|uniref:mechanosensitive ion channel protein MscS n=1 Tax=Bordetella sp. TaxID=28081 RepID=UPI0039C86E93